VAFNHAPPRALGVPLELGLAKLLLILIAEDRPGELLGVAVDLRSGDVSHSKFEFVFVTENENENENENDVWLVEGMAAGKIPPISLAPLLSSTQDAGDTNAG
jgi:hypothetical protein